MLDDIAFLPLTSVAASIVLAALGVSLVIRVWKDQAEYKRFKAASQSRERRRFFRKWTMDAFLYFSGVTLLLLAATGELGALTAMPPVFLATPLGEAIAVARGAEIAAFNSEQMIGFAIGFSIATVAAIGVWIFQFRRAAKGAPTIVGDVEPLLPRNFGEGVWAAIMSVNAGVSEELFFRLLLPLLFVAATGDATIAFALSALIFGAVHLYQGFAGVLATTVVGVVLTAIYISTGSLLAVIIVHIVLNLRALILMPALGALFVKRGGTGP
jgi:membrane protease YdiL (CAAX protease family)